MCRIYGPPFAERLDDSGKPLDEACGDLAVVGCAAGEAALAAEEIGEAAGGFAWGARANGCETRDTV